VPEGEPCCPRCGHSIPICFTTPPQEKDVPWGEADDETDDAEFVAQGGLPADASDDGIFDPELLEQAEEYVKFLPDGLFRRGERPRMPVAGGGAEGDGVVAWGDRGNGGDEVAAEDAEPQPVGSECPACGRQAQKGWRECPWCGAALGLDVSR
jgi:hypothetical protein